MPKLTLQFGDRVIHECGVQAEVTIGRLPDNTIVIDNPAVSGHHARVFRDGGDVIVEDLRSKNGTYVNEQHVLRATLKSGDMLLIGKHKILFDEADATENGAPACAAPTTLAGTAYLDTKQHRAMLARLREARMARESAAKTASAAGTMSGGSAPDDCGVLRVLTGSAHESEYRLVAPTSVIGKSETAFVRLRGWLKPQVAAAIVREGTRYFLTPAAGATLVNGEHLHSRRELLDGDVLEVSGLVAEFRREGESRGTSPHPNVA